MIYKIVSEFTCCGKTLVTVIMEKKAACVMEKREFNRIIETERKFCKLSKTK